MNKYLGLVEFLRGPGVSFKLHKTFKTTKECDLWLAEMIRLYGSHGVRCYMCEILNFMEG